MPSLALAPASNARTVCRQVEFEGEVSAGRSFEKVFAAGFEFGLEALPSGWIVRVLRTDEARGAHDYAELATPPYQSVSPLLISTDWAFRAQDAVAWNPRHFQYAGTKAAFQALLALEPKAMEGDGPSSARASVLISGQPSGTLQVLDSLLAPGTADQSQMAAVVALHLSTTPHSADSLAPPTKLGKLERMRFRVTLELPPGSREVPGLREEACNAHPTGAKSVASQQSRTRVGK